MVKGAVLEVQIKKLRQGRTEDTCDLLAIEEPLEIQLGYDHEGNQIQKTISVTMRTPGNDEELAAGFLFTEGIIQNKEQLKTIQAIPFDENRILITLQNNDVPALHKTERNFYTTSSCGVCGKASIDAIKTVSIYKNETDTVSLKAPVLYGLQDTLRKQQAIFKSTGGLHASALFSLDADFIMLREDIGRHNALDKVIGNALITGQLPLNNCILLLSGRASFELLQKATMAGIKVVVAIGAPSSLAVQLAQEAGITLVGFLRNESCNIYSGEHRIRI